MATRKCQSFLLFLSEKGVFWKPLHLYTLSLPGIPLNKFWAFFVFTFFLVFFGKLWLRDWFSFVIRCRWLTNHWSFSQFTRTERIGLTYACCASQCKWLWRFLSWIWKKKNVRFWLVLLLFLLVYSLFALRSRRPVLEVQADERI